MLEVFLFFFVKMATMMLMSDEKVMVRSCDLNRSDSDSSILQPNFLGNMKYAKHPQYCKLYFFV